MDPFATPPIPDPGPVRLQKLLSAAGVASRRAAEQLMLDGRVTVNGRAVREPGARADPARDDVRVDGRRVARRVRRRYVVLNKPRGYVTTRKDPHRRKTVLDLIPGVREYVYPVGRLDYDSEGLLLLTNDGALAALLTHPRHGVARVYEATVRGVPSGARLRRLASGGVEVDGRPTAPAEVRMLHGAVAGRDGEAQVRIVIREGRNRQVRRMFDAIGHPVRRLRRTRLGPLGLRGLRPGAARDLTPAEVVALRRAVRTASSPPPAGHPG
jgi:23S rRNA pseudouridine2605 synthase